MSRKPVIGVMGGGYAVPSIAGLAHDLGEAIARQGWILLNGGRNAGVMAASAEGASEAGGFVVGVLPGRDRSDASLHLDLAIITGMGDARNAINVLSSDVVVALPGGAGTVSEIALAIKAGKRPILLGWQKGDLSPVATADQVCYVETAEDAIAAVRQILMSSN